MTSLQEKWGSWKANNYQGSIRFSKELYQELNDLHKSMFHKNIERGCPKCTKNAFERVFKQLDYDKKELSGTTSAEFVTLVNEPAREIDSPILKKIADSIPEEKREEVRKRMAATTENQSKKVHMTFPKHTPKTDKLSDIYGDINDNVSVQFHAHMVEAIRVTLWKAFIPMEGMTAYVIDSKIYEGALAKKSIKIIQEGEVDLLVCLEGTSEEIEKKVDKLKPRFIHSNMDVPGYQQLGSALREGILYRR